MLPARTPQNLPNSRSISKWKDKSAGTKDRDTLRENLAKRLGLKEVEDWYEITTNEIISNGGEEVLKRTRNSPPLLVQAMFPEHDWNFGRFVDTGPSSFQKQFERNRIKCASSSSSWRKVEWLADKLKVEQLEDWYRVSFQEINKWAPAALLHKRNLGRFLQESYPEHPWDLGRLENKSGVIKSSQRILFVAVKELFPNSGT